MKAKHTCKRFDITKLGMAGAWFEAERRLRKGWKQKRCKVCGLFGWLRPCEAKPHHPTGAPK